MNFCYLVITYIAKLMVETINRLITSYTKYSEEVLKMDFSMFFLLIFGAVNVFADDFSTNVPSQKKIVFEITDKFNEVRLGLTENSVYMIFTERIKNISNNKFKEQYLIEAENFEDSEGNFLSNSATRLTSNSLEILFKDIQTINFRNGKLNFEYYSSSVVGFEEIQSFNGTNVLNNFYIEDLESFVFMFNKSA